MASYLEMEVKNYCYCIVGHTNDQAREPLCQVSNDTRWRNQNSTKLSEFILHPLLLLYSHILNSCLHILLLEGIFSELLGIWQQERTFSCPCKFYVVGMMHLFVSPITLMMVQLFCNKQKWIWMSKWNWLMSRSHIGRSIK